MTNDKVDLIYAGDGIEKSIWIENGHVTFQKNVPLPIVRFYADQILKNYGNLFHVLKPEERINFMQSGGSIEITRGGGLGDLIMLLPCLKAMKQLYPNHKLKLKVSGEYEPLFKSVSYLDEVTSGAVTSNLKIDCNNVTETSGDRSFKHRTDIFADYLGIQVTDKEPELSLSNEVKNNFAEYKDSIVISLGSRGANRRLDFAKWQEIIDILALNNYHVIITGEVAIRFNAHKNVVNLSGKLSVLELASLVWQSACLIGLDSGAVHLAGALRKPFVALFGEWNHELRLKYYRNYRVIQHKELSCCPCNGAGCHIDLQCMKLITAKDVLETTEELLSGISDDIKSGVYMENKSTRIFVPSGIGDISWLYSKLIDYAKEHEVIMEIATDVPARPNRALEYVKTLPFIRKVKYGYFTTLDVYRGTRENAHINIPIESHFSLNVNQWMERGNYLKDFWGNQNTYYHYEFNANEKAQENVERNLSGLSDFKLIGVQTGEKSYFGGNPYSPDDWFKIFSLLAGGDKNKTACVLIGAEYDNNLLLPTNEILKRNGYKTLLWNTHDISETILMMKKLDLLIGTASGITVLADVNKVKSIILYPECFKRPYLVGRWESPEGYAMSLNFDKPENIYNEYNKRNTTVPTMQMPISVVQGCV